MIITVGHSKGGVSKSRLATHLACLAVQEGVDAVLLDTDTQGSSVSWSRIRNEDRIEPEVPVLALPGSPARELANLSRKYTLMVVDIGANSYQMMGECAALSDLVLVPCGPDQQEMEETLQVFAMLRALDPRHPTGKVTAYAVLTRVSPVAAAKATEQLQEFLEEAGVPVLRSRLALRSAWLNAGRTGRAVNELSKKDGSEKATVEIGNLYAEVKKVLRKKKGA